MGHCLFLALAISDWLLPRTPLHLRASRLPAIRMEKHYSAVKCNYLHSPIPESIDIYLKFNLIFTLLTFQYKLMSKLIGEECEDP